MQPVLKFEKFSALVATWESVFSDAADFATQVGRERVVSISHSADRHEAIVTVWYWSE